MASPNWQVGRKTNTFISPCGECKLMKTLLGSYGDVCQSFKRFDPVFHFHECVERKSFEMQIQLFIKSGHHRIMYKENYEKHPKYLE